VEKVVEVVVVRRQGPSVRSVKRVWARVKRRRRLVGYIYRKVRGEFTIGGKEVGIRKRGGRRA